MPRVEAGLERMGPRHVRHRAAEDVGREVVLEAVEARRTRVDAEGLPVEERNERHVGDIGRPHLLLRPGRSQVAQERPARLEQQPVARRKGPGRLRQVDRPIGVVDRRVHVGDAVLRPEMALAAALKVLRERQLVLLARLHREANAVVLVVPVQPRRTVRVRRIERCVGRHVEVPRRLEVLRAPPAVRGVEPDPVSHDRPTHADAVVPHLLVLGQR